VEENKTFSRINGDGLIEVVDVDSGQILAIQQTMQDLYQKKENRLVQVYHPDDGREIWLERGLSLDSLGEAADYLAFSQILSDIICDKIVNGGKTITKICNEKGMPDYRSVCYWRRTKPEFKEALHQAKLDRAESYHDKVLEEADTVDETNSKSKKVKIDALKWAASVGNPSEYSSQTKVVGDKDAPVQIIVDTGIRRPNDGGYNKDETEGAKDVTPSLEESKSGN